MQEYIINGLLIVVALLAVILQIIGTRSSAGMTKKQKVMLWRILTATVLLLILQVLGAGAFEVFGAAGRWIRLAVFLVDYLVIGYDILKKAGKEDFCFVEGKLPPEYEKNITQIILYRWNRKYPADIYFQIDLNRWKMTGSWDFTGSSHEKITKEIYEKKEIACASK